MGGVLEVAKGSRHEPKFLILKYNGGQEEEKPYVVVGKGVTFDSGGISLKPPPGMANMKMDCRSCLAARIKVKSCWTYTNGRKYA